MKDNKGSALLALTAAAIMLQGASKKVEASTPDQKTTFDYRFSHYDEAPLGDDITSKGSRDRYSIDVNQFSFKTPVTDDTEVSISGVQESMSGASPWYVRPSAVTGGLVQVMSGATIEEDRSELNVDFHSFNSRSENTLSAGYSSENDYTSFSFGYAGALNFKNKVSTLSYSINTSMDYIEPTQLAGYDRTKEEDKNRLGMSVGFSQIVTKNTLVNVSLSFAQLKGYLSDPYKLAWVNGAAQHDSRPDSNNQFAVLLNLREFFPSANAAFHADYRFYTNDWGLVSNTMEVSWHQNIGKTWMLIPSFRSYKQGAADFYQPYYSSLRNDGFYSCDYRLSEFSANSGQLKLVKNFDTVAVNISYESYVATGDNPGVVSYGYYALGIGKKF
jgi:hypothetical protein